MIIVTGAAGLIGSAVIEALNGQGQDKIIAVDHLGHSDKWKNLQGLDFLDYLEKYDFLDKLQAGQLNHATAIIHLGACSDTRETDASYLIENNFEYSKALAKHALSREIRFICASSAATYGDGAQGYDDQATIDGLKPLNMYGYSKHLMDLWALRSQVLPKIVSLKYFNVFGPREQHKGDMRSVVCKAFEQVEETRKVSLFKSYKPEYQDGQQKRDFLYVKDAAAMTLFFLDHPEAGGIFNIGSGKAQTWLDLVHAVFEAMGKEPNIEFIDMPEDLREKYQYFTQAPMDKLHSAGYKQPLFSLKDAVADYYSTRD